MRTILEMICKNHNDKMYGMGSLSTSCLCNGNCNRNKEIKGSICEHCFAANMCEMFSNLNQKLQLNAVALSTHLYGDDEIPVLTGYKYFRFEAFGDLINGVQLRNYIAIAKKNPHIKFALWTKVPKIVDAVLECEEDKPKNMNFIVSSLFLNKSIMKYQCKWWVDKVFTVYSKSGLWESGRRCNCGAKSCLTCGLCYEHNDVFYVNELLK